jgi:hypothetical protein
MLIVGSFYTTLQKCKLIAIINLEDHKTTSTSIKCPVTYRTSKKKKNKKYKRTCEHLLARNGKILSIEIHRG